jgi:hypothetical protein
MQEKKAFTDFLAVSSMVRLQDCRGILGIPENTYLLTVKKTTDHPWEDLHLPTHSS